MKKRNFVLFVVMALILFNGRLSFSAEKPEHEFVGVKKCSMCHKTSKIGNQYGVWKESNHAVAFDTLGTPQAKALGESLGIENPQTSGECLKCHSTAYWFSEERVTDKISVEEGVSCESCHGPGKDYINMKIMKDRDKAIENGLLIAGEATCLQCHHDQRPNATEFHFEESWEKIKHPVSK